MLTVPPTTILNRKPAILISTYLFTKHYNKFILSRIICRCIGLVLLCFLIVGILVSITFSIGVGAYNLIIRGQEYENKYAEDNILFLVGLSIVGFASIGIFASCMRQKRGRCVSMLIMMIFGWCLIFGRNIYYALVPLVYIIAFIFVIVSFVLCIYIFIGLRDGLLYRLKSDYIKYKNCNSEFYEYYWMYILDGNDRIDYIVDNWTRYHFGDRQIYDDIKSLIHQFLLIREERQQNYGSCDQRISRSESLSTNSINSIINHIY